MRNPLASPFTLGISQSAAFGASVAIVLLGAFAHESAYLLVAACAFVSAFSAMLLVLLLGRIAAFSPTTLILGGVAIGTLFGAATMLLQYFGSDAEVAATLFWTFGDLSKAIWAHVWMLLGALALVGAYAMRHHWQMDALLLGDERAQALGINPSRLRLGLLLGASLLGALAVAFFGVIGFIGLAAPHLVRLLLGSSHGALIPLSALCGAALLLGADWLSKTVLAPVVLPVGIMTAFLGAPLFLVLLVR